MPPAAPCSPDQRFRLHPESVLKQSDRCDGCSAQAIVRVTHPDLGELIFCNHHFNQHEPALLAEGFTVAERVEVPA